jgi:hypothetical protein
MNIAYHSFQEKEIHLMATMQAFYKRLSTTAKTNGAYQHDLTLLTRVNRTDLLNLSRDLQWAIWD